MGRQSGQVACKCDYVRLHVCWDRVVHVSIRFRLRPTPATSRNPLRSNHTQSEPPTRGQPRLSWRRLSIHAKPWNLHECHDVRANVASHSPRHTDLSPRLTGDQPRYAVSQSLHCRERPMSAGPHSHPSRLVQFVAYRIRAAGDSQRSVVPAVTGSAQSFPPPSMPQTVLDRPRG